VFHGGKLTAGCTPLAGTTTGGTCGSEGSAPGYAATSGGIGTPSYMPVTPGGTVLGTGTAVDAISTWKSGAWVLSNAEMTYSFQATGPANVDFVPIDILSDGLLSASGDSAAYLSLIIRAPDLKGPLLELTASCIWDHCVSDWYTADHELTDLLCIQNGDNYTITIDALTTAGPGWGADNTASAVLDPRIILDPPYPTSCPVDVPLSELGVNTGPGASTGYLTAGVPEPSPLGMAAIGALGLACLGLRRRRVASRR
jgi:hypothetical protein